MQELYGKHIFSFLPETFILPKEYDQLAKEIARDPFQYWIAKPAGSSQGKGIIITNKLRDINRHSV